MKSIFPFIDNYNNHNKTSYKSKQLSLNSNERLKTDNNFRNHKSIKSKFFSNNTNYFSPNIKFFRNNNFMNTIEDFSKKVKEEPIKEYRKHSEDLMLKYSYYNPKAETEENLINYEDEMTETKASFFRKTKKDIQKYLKESKKLMKTQKNFK